VLIPEKHVRLSDSLLGLGSYVLVCLSKPKDIDQLWKKFKNDSIHQRDFGNHSINNLVLAIDFLFSVGLVKIDEGGKIFRENSRIVSKSEQFQNDLFQ
jgi:hypothetical protein